ncbi:MAG: hypothetical protein U0746_19525 [Gemmataceae bacterium]
MYTSLIGFALAASFAPAANPAPTWMTDYRQARETGGREQKPLVVVLGTEGSSWAKLAKAVEADPTINATLRDKYVCLFVDTATEAGQKLAKAFEMSGPGLVISDRSGEFQEFRTAGELPVDQLSRTLLSYTGMVTESRKVAPTTAPTPTGAPVQSFYPQSFFPGFGGGYCPNCR